MTFSDGATVLAVVAVDAKGKALFTTSSLATGVHTITATYNGDADHTTSTVSRSISIT